MALKYTLPQDVLSPKDYVKKVDVLFDGGEESFAIAKIVWEGGDCIGIRWNASMRELEDPLKLEGEIVCKGMPVSRGYSVWFNLPLVFHPFVQTIIEKEKERLKTEQRRAAIS